RLRAQESARLSHHVRHRRAGRREASRARARRGACGALHHRRRGADGGGRRDWRRSDAVRLVDVGGPSWHRDAAPVGHAGARAGLRDPVVLSRRDDDERRREAIEGAKERESTMTAGVTSGERFRSWAEIGANAARAAGGFAALGIGEDDSVALMLRNDFATFEVNMAAGQLGAYAVPINWHFTAEEAGYILADCRAKALVIHADLLAQVAAG